ncbi:MAG: bifunctional nuclease family protein [Candidatus Aenigmarchaeota archaeon]|nr:bifunctional nuclease family protein [Candidatus Aenigmarchaeota archaeon]
MTETIVLFKSRGGFKRFVLALGIIIVLVVAFWVAFYPQALPISNAPVSFAKAPISLDGFEQTEVTVSPGVIHLISNCRELAIVTTELQTHSINNGFEEKVDFRPDSHDLFRDVTENFGISVRLVKVEKLKDSTYYARLYVQQGNRLLGLDSKPSDAIAVAARFGAPVYVKTVIMETSGEEVC